MNVFLTWHNVSIMYLVLGIRYKNGVYTKIAPFEVSHLIGSVRGLVIALSLRTFCSLAFDLWICKGWDKILAHANLH